MNKKGPGKGSGQGQPPANPLGVGLNDLKMIKSDYRCKVCQLAHWDWPMFVKIHEMRILEKKSFEALRLYVWERIDKYNSDPSNAIKRDKMSDTSFTGHFKNHVPASVEAASAIQKVLGTGNQNGADSGNMLVTTLQYALNANVDDFQAFHGIAERLLARFNQLDKQFGVDKPLEGKEVQEFKGIAESAAKLYEASIKMRNQERLMATAISSCLDVYTMGALQDILKGFDEIMLDIKSAIAKGGAGNPGMPAIIEHRFKTILANAMTGNAKVALDSVKLQFKMA